MRSVVVLLSLLAPLASASAQDSDSGYAALSGLRELRVVVESLHPSSTQAGLVAAQLHADLERQLRALGFTIGAPASRGPYLYLRITTREEPEQGFPYTVELILRDSVRLVRDPNVQARASTWARSRGGYGRRTNDELAREVRAAITDMVDRFGRDHRVANRR